MNGRPNKIVDSCYTYWVLATVKMLFPDVNHKLFNAQSIRKCVLVAAQSEKGGFSDHPDKKGDPYHTCYSISGLALLKEMKLADEKGPVVEDLRRVDPLLTRAVL
eukprot:Trichotokara_eunicae@DN3253_c0_g1_i2.p1